MSIVGAFKSIGGAFNSGLEAGVGKGIGFKGVGAVLGLGAAGAAIGASATAISSDGSIDPLTGAAVGGAIGASALPAAGLAVGLVGSATVGALKMAPTAGAAIGHGIAASSPYAAAIGANIGSKVGSSIWNTGSKLINWDNGADVLSKVKISNPLSGFKAGWTKGIESAAGTSKFNKFTQGVSGAVSGGVINGATLLGATAAVEGAKLAWNTMEKAHMGQNMGTQTMTPQIPSYADNAGATGDLVFALNANRRG